MKFKVAYDWLHNKYFDLLFLISPSFVSVIIALFYSEKFSKLSEIPTWGWVVLILGIDVTHVYSTLFRTYFHQHEFTENKVLLTIVPLLCLVFGIIIYSMSASFFWRILAYIAVFHFIRQQYGFMRLYSRSEQRSVLSRKMDTLMIYLSMLYPIFYWHSHEPRNFHWFVEGDFIGGLPYWFSYLSYFLYLVVIICYIVKELFYLINFRTFNLTKNLIILGTAISWYFGIVFTNNDASFTITNVMTHGIPYIALVWVYGNKQTLRKEKLTIPGNINYIHFFSPWKVPLFLSLLFLFSYIEEGFWAGFVWREHLDFFTIFEWLPEIKNHDTLSILVPLLTLPQITHYILDGFIWKIRSTKSYWNHLFFSSN